MPSAVSPKSRASPQDDLDALFDSDVELDQIRNSANRENKDAADNDKPTTSNLDEEIVITKKRQPIAKLDEQRILSAKGIPRLRTISKKMRFKGKGHEFSDMSRLLNMYQLWLDDLYPRAKFADGLAMIEKLGHKKRIQMMRKEWIDEAKPKPQELEREHDVEESTEGLQNTEQQAQQSVVNEEQPQPQRIEPQSMEPKKTTATAQQQDEPDMDELDALLAEAEPSSRNSSTRQDADAFADEEEAMAGMDW
ncbi:chromosome segregation in meiosis protein 3 [Elsinoe australis]|uniref:Chromosome segregation in meiosis protein n=1 Tax=Elsinoe australis TaxID=40998 RepID=A0A4U7B8Z3_9PEZI|nr:chromosome segregation in meiosis protein 3 [Elsinoe australis]